MPKQILPISDITTYAGTAVACVITAVYGFSGGPNVSASRALLLIAWVCGLLHFATYQFLATSLLYFIWFAVVWTLILVLLGYLIVPAVIPSNIGFLVDRRELWSRKKRKLAVEIGDSGSRFIPVGEAINKPLFNFFDESDLRVERHGIRRLFSTTVVDPEGEVVARIERNKFEVLAEGADFNYDKNALEVRHSSGRILLQVEFARDSLRFQGEWWSRDGTAGIRFVSLGPGRVSTFVRLAPRDVPAEPAIRPLFIYPSKDHHGERA